RARGARARRAGGLRRGRAGGLLGRDAGVAARVPGGGGARADRRRSLRARVRRPALGAAPGRAGREAGARRRAARLGGQAARPAGVAHPRPGAHEPGHLVHDRHRLGARHRDRTRRAEGYRFLKVKVGGPDDLARLEAVRENSDARIRIDGNEGWTLETARELMPRLRELEVEFVEQPFPVADVDSYRALRELPERIPVILDESVRGLADVGRAAGIADGINIKLAKSGGIREGLRMIHAARALDLQVMIGCMIESELGISQSVQIASLVDHVDLDGHLLISDAPFSGLGFRDGGVVASAEPGLGVTPA